MPVLCNKNNGYYIKILKNGLHNVQEASQHFQLPPDYRRFGPHQFDGAEVFPYDEEGHPYDMERQHGRDYEHESE